MNVTPHAAPVAAPYWRIVPPVCLSALQKHWLHCPGALTEGLRQLGALRLQVLREYAGGAPTDEAQALGVAVRTPVWVREILMSIDGVPVVFARSLTGLRASRGVWQGMRRLRARPLADMLYHDRRICRSGFAQARVGRALALHAGLRRAGLLAWPEGRAEASGLLARRSVFRCAGQALVVAECFLPAFWAMARRL